MTDEGSNGEEDVEDIEHGDVADSPVGLMESLAAQKQGQYFTEAENTDEVAMCHDPDCNSTTIINKDILCCNSLGCYITVRAPQLVLPTLLNMFYIVSPHMSRLDPEACWRLIL